MIIHSRHFILILPLAIAACHIIFTVAYSFEGNEQFRDKGKSWFYANEGLLIGLLGKGQLVR